MRWWEPYAMLGQQPPILLEILPLGPSPHDLHLMELRRWLRDEVMKGCFR